MKGDIKQIGNYSYNKTFLIGEGAFGKVYKGKINMTGEEIAIKKLDLVTIEKDQYLKSALANEIQILKQFNHPNIVQFYDMISLDDSLYIITEFCKDGDLREYMRRKKLKESEVISMMIQIANGFKALYQNGIIHRDLKPANILNNNGIIKIADFGFAKYVDNYSNQLLRSCVGSPLYMAPQVLSKQSYTTKCDIWSLGVIYYEMLFNEVPWKGRSEQDLLNNIRTKPLEMKPCSKFSEDFLRQALTYEQNDRISWERIFDLFDQQEKQLNQQNSLKKSYVFHKEEKEQVVELPGQLQQPNLQGINKIIKKITNMKSEIQFRHFVNVEMFTKQHICKRFIKQELAYEMFYALLSKLLLFQTKQLFNQSEQIFVQQECGIPDEQIGLFMKTLKTEHEYAAQFSNDVREFLEMLGTLPNMLQNDEFRNFYELGNVNDPFAKKYEDMLTVQARSIVKDSLNELKSTKQLQVAGTIEFLSILDYILDILLIRKRLQKTQDIDYDQVHQEFSGIKDPVEYYDKLVFKLRQVEAM